MPGASPVAAEARARCAAFTIDFGHVGFLVCPRFGREGDIEFVDAVVGQNDSIVGGRAVAVRFVCPAGRAFARLRRGRQHRGDSQQPG